MAVSAFTLWHTLDACRRSAEPWCVLPSRQRVFLFCQPYWRVAWSVGTYGCFIPVPLLLTASLYSQRRCELPIQFRAGNKPEDCFSHPPLSSGYLCTPTFNIKKLSVTRISEQTAVISLYGVNWLAFITETESVYCAVGVEFLSVIRINFSLLKGKMLWVWERRGNRGVKKTA